MTIRFRLRLSLRNPLLPRDSARLFAYSRSTGKVSHDTFAHAADYLPENAVLVFNETKVFPARLTLKKETGGMVRILYTGITGKYLRALADRPLNIGAKISLNSGVFFTVEGKEGSEYLLRPSFPPALLKAVFQKHGSTPIPPYIKHSPLPPRELKKQYQTVFAKRTGSVAAPTASLHFTKRLLKKMRNAGVATRFITLHVGLGTFAPLAEENIRQEKLHLERYAIDAKTAVFLNKAKKRRPPHYRRGHHRSARA